ncbi:hypothetical protein LEP1GSC058_2330 [Leptospira fainei serovar Hurstbridge str. BUT 6]|uniref:Uncharacterized protein n=1 Tax=Leptospira fainei serovar Hurstbridge str. BUT 6 TaxID=1193011 RepID=S3W558_9LEPT|nr:hypothetical protein [Leptospira fainei]EPG75382.1 hypothetical protein LEP1GSC058_2330 [Leptospira fainei serovar Hurstbridge str. BUT 6]
MKVFGILVGGFLFLFNCATFTSYPEGFNHSEYGRPAQTGNKTVSVVYTQKAILGTKEVQVNANAIERMQENLRNGLNDSGYFKSVGSSLDNTDLKLRVEALNEGGGEIYQVMAFISGLTFTILPALAPDHFTLTYTFKDKNDKIKKQYIRKATFNTWIQLFLIFAMPFKSPKKEIYEGIKQMTYSVLEEASLVT